MMFLLAVTIAAALSSTTAQFTPLQCHGVGGDTWMLSRDMAVSAAEHFCRQDVKDQEYNQNTADSVKLSALIIDDSKTPSTIDDCIGKFKLIIDSCDFDPINNPHNYKFGGTYTSLVDRSVAKSLGC
jgi:Alpha-galactosyl-binding fungal lectin